MTKLADILGKSDRPEFGPPAVARLMTAGLSGLEAMAKLSSIRQCAQAMLLAGVSDNAELVAYFVPGRIEVVGKHTDYGGGRSILCAVERGFTFLAARRTDNIIRILTNKEDEPPAEFRLDPELVPDMGTWTGYPRTVARRVARNFPSARTGADIAFASDLPRASGMSSSSAMVVGMFLILSAINHLPDTPEYKANISTPEDLAGYLGTIENGQTFKSLAGDKGVGTFGGSEDHTAILLSKPNQLVQYSYCPVHAEGQFDFPSDLTFVIASSGVIAEKTGSAMTSYNRASLLAQGILLEWNRLSGRPQPTLAAAVQAAGPDAIRTVLNHADHPDFSADDLRDRFEQFVIENEQIVPGFSMALNARDFLSLGRIVDSSQSLSEIFLKNQVPQTIFLAKSARGLGAIAASSFGAGFGGSVWAIVPNSAALSFIAEWQSRYLAEFPDDAARSVFFPTRPGPAAFELTL